MNTIIITNDTGIAKDAAAAGVQRIMVDLETIGKQERQKNLNAFFTSHTAEDIRKIRSALKKSELIVRVNPFYDGSRAEIENAIESGADIIMLPMITHISQVEEVAKIIAGRAKFLPLIETAYSMAYIEEIAANESVSELYIGLNDLHLSLGLKFLFEPLALGIVDFMAEKIKKQGKIFGFGGIATMGSGELPAERILAEHVRLSSKWVILSSRFGKDIFINEGQGRGERIKQALANMQEKEAEFSSYTQTQMAEYSKETMGIIKRIATPSCATASPSAGLIL